MPAILVVTPVVAHYSSENGGYSSTINSTYASTLSSHRSAPTLKLWKPSGYEPVNKMTNQATMVTIPQPKKMKTNTMKCGIARRRRRATVSRSRGPVGSTISIDAAYGASPKGGYGSSNSM